MPFRKLHNNFNYLVVYLTRSPAAYPRWAVLSLFLVTVKLNLVGLPVTLPNQAHGLFTRVDTDGRAELTLDHADFWKLVGERGVPVIGQVGIVGVDDRD